MPIEQVLTQILSATFFKKISRKLFTCVLVITPSPNSAHASATLITNTFQAQTQCLLIRIKVSFPELCPRRRVKSCKMWFSALDEDSGSIIVEGKASGESDGFFRLYLQRNSPSSRNYDNFSSPLATKTSPKTWKSIAIRAWLYLCVRVQKSKQQKQLIASEPSSKLQHNWITIFSDWAATWRSNWIFAERAREEKYRDNCHICGGLYDDFFRAFWVFSRESEAKKI